MAESSVTHSYLTEVEQRANPKRRVYKYPLQLHSGPQVVTMPHGAQIVHVHEQDDRPVLWAEVNTTGPAHDRIYWVFATGEDIPIRVKRHVGTIHVGWTVWHVYEEV